MFQMRTSNSTLAGLVVLAATLLPARVPAARLPEPSSAPSESRSRRFT